MAATYFTMRGLSDYENIITPFNTVEIKGYFSALCRVFLFLFGNFTRKGIQPQITAVESGGIKLFARQTQRVRLLMSSIKDKTISKHLAANLKYWMSLQGMSYGAFADSVPLPRPYFSILLKAEQNPTENTISRLAELVGVEAWELVLPLEQFLLATKNSRSQI